MDVKIIGIDEELDINWTKTIWLAPPNIIYDIKKDWIGVKPLSIAIIPYIIPNGNTPNCKGNSSKTPCLKIVHLFIIYLQPKKLLEYIIYR